LACGMNARGSTEVIIATVGLSMGALNQNLFTMIVAMAVVTTLAMPPSLRWALARIPMRKEEKQRLEREELEERGFVPNLERLLVAIDDSPNGKFASRVAGMLAGTRGMPTTVLHITDTQKIEAKTADGEPAKAKTTDSKSRAATQKTSTKKSADEIQVDDETATAAAADSDKTQAKADAKAEVKKAGKAEEKKAEQAGETVKQAAEQIQKKQTDAEKSDNRVDVTTIVHEAPGPDAIAEEAKKGYDLMMIGVATTTNGGSEFHESVESLALGFEGPLAIADTRGELAARPNGRLSIMVPVNGTESSRRAAEVAIVLARATRAPLTVMYVAVRGRKTKSKPDGKRRSTRTRQQEEAVLKDIVAIADGYDVIVRTAVLPDDAPDDAFLRQVSRRQSNLIVMGMGRRPGEKLFLGESASSLLEDSEVSLLFVAS
jgi:nucleotide-binding universal stress UspA family protein